GLLSAMKRNTLLDQAAMGVALIGQSAPTFFLGILFILLLSLKADLFPTSGRGDWKNLVLPAMTLGAFTMASIARLTRSAVLEVLRADFVGPRGRAGGAGHRDRRGEAAPARATRAMADPPGRGLRPAPGRGGSGGPVGAAAGSRAPVAPRAPQAAGPRRRRRPRAS